MLRIGLVGVGTHATWAVVPAIRDTEGRCTLLAAADTNAENLARIEDSSVARFDDHRRMLAEAELDAVYIATLSDTHAEIAVDALRTGLHVICEKPMANTAGDCERMVGAARDADRVLAVDFETRYDLGNMAARRWITDGRLGRVEAVHIQHFWDGHKAFGALADRRHRLAAMAGALDCGIHKADLVRYWCGGRWREVRSLGRWFGEDLTPPPHVAALAELDNGVLVNLTASFSYTAYIEPRAESDVLTIVGTDGIISEMYEQREQRTLRLVSKSGEETLTADQLTAPKPIAQLLRDVADAAEGRQPLPPEAATGEDGWQAQVFVEQANAEAAAKRIDP